MQTKPPMNGAKLSLFRLLSSELIVKLFSKKMLLVALVSSSFSIRMYELGASPTLVETSAGAATATETIEIKTVLLSEDDFLQRFRTAFAALARGHLSEAQVALSFLSGKFGEVFSGTLARLLEGHTERLIGEIEVLVGASGSIVAGGRPPRKLSRYIWEPILIRPKTCSPSSTPRTPRGAPGVIQAKVPLSGPPRDPWQPNREGAGHFQGAVIGLGRVLTP